ncbi:MAG: YihY/virulence factor BrkB family protein [Pseudomonadota bacterium]
MNARALLGWIGAVLARFEGAGGTVLSGYIAYTGMLALFPFLIFASALTGFLIGPEGLADALRVLFEPFPEHARTTLEPVIAEVIGERRSGVLTLSGLGALWAASNGMEAVRLGLDAAYRPDAKRRYAINRLYLFGMVVLGVGAFVTLAGLVVLAPLVFALIEGLFGMEIPFIANLARYGLAFALLWGVLWMLHRVLPSRRMRGLRLWPGILASVLVWGTVATAMSLYLAFAPSYTLTYGTLAGVVVTLLFFYLTGVALLFGAHVNAEINGIAPARQPPPGTATAP